MVSFFVGAAGGSAAGAYAYLSTDPNVLFIDSNDENQNDAQSHLNQFLPYGCIFEYYTWAAPFNIVIGC